MSVNIKEISPEDKNAIKKFVEYPVDILYKDCPFYVPSLNFDESRTLNPKINPAFDFCEMQLFLAYKDDRIVGRIAAIINHNANEIWKKKSVRFGFVDFIDDVEVVDALFNAAQMWGENKGMTSIIGPMGFTDFDHEGLLIHGFDKMSTMATSYSYPYYRQHIERMGFEKEVDWKEFYIPVPKETPERHKRIAEMVMQRYGLEVLKVKNLKQVKPYINGIFSLLNLAYSPLYGFSPLTQRQIDYYVEMYVSLLRWDLVTIVVKKGTADIVGFGIGIPNLSEALIKTKGKFFPIGWYHLLKALKCKKNKKADLMLIGIDPQYQGKGVNAIIFNDFIPSAYNCGFRFVESNPELEINNKMVSLWDGFDAVNHKTRRAYIKHLNS